MQNPKNIFNLGAVLIGLFLIMIVPEVRADSGSLSGTASATGIEKKKHRKFETDIVFSAGYRKDDLDWNIGGYLLPDHYVNVLSELTWDDLESYQVKFQGSLIFPNIIALRAIADYGWIFDGDNQDSDYAGNDRTREFSRSNSNSDDDDVWDVSLAIGYPFRTGRKEIGRAHV